MLWGLKQLEPRAVYGIAVDLLQRQIHTGLLLPGERLPAERQLSEKFGISRVTLRDALRVLESDAYITIRRGAQGGAFVAEERALCDLARRRITREPAKAMRVVEFLAVNQLAAAKVAATRRGPADLKRLRQAQEMMRSSSSEPQRKQASAIFLLALGEATQNQLLARAIEDGLAELFLPFNSDENQHIENVGMNIFGALLDAIECENAIEAEQAMGDLNDLFWSLIRKIISHTS